MAVAEGCGEERLHSGQAVNSIWVSGSAGWQHTHLLTDSVPQCVHMKGDTWADKGCFLLLLYLPFLVLMSSCSYFPLMSVTSSIYSHLSFFSSSTLVALPYYLTIVFLCFFSASLLTCAFPCLSSVKLFSLLLYFLSISPFLLTSKAVKELVQEVFLEFVPCQLLMM